MPEQDAKLWFDQFPPEALAQIGDNEQWCARHWAPCPMFGANGMGATVELMKIFVTELASATTPDGLNEEMHNIGKICCTLGDERMYQIWGRWPPVPMQGMN